MARVRGCIQDECRDCLYSEQGEVTQRRNYKWYPYEAFMNCRDCDYKYGSSACIDYRNRNNATIIHT